MRLNNIRSSCQLFFMRAVSIVLKRCTSWNQFYDPLKQINLKRHGKLVKLNGYFADINYSKKNLSRRTC